MSSIDLNADMAESFGRWTLGDDEALLPLVTSANVACGFHAGDPETMRSVCEQASALGTAIGAQVSYRDLAGFGRRFLDVSSATLRQEVLYQIAALDGIARAAGTRVTYVKPHGALYHALADHPGQAQAVVDAIIDFDPGLMVLGQPEALWLRRAQDTGLHVVHEAFADRAYTAQGRLVPRGESGAVLDDVEAITSRCVALSRGEPIADVEGNPLLVQADSICVHGDTPGAVGIARAVHEALMESGSSVRAFAPSPGSAPAPPDRDHHG